MTEEDAFHAAIHADCSDAVARGAYADWLDEHERPVEAATQRVCARPDDDAMRLAFADAAEAAGQVERAEFVRVQCELARRGCYQFGCEKVHREKYSVGKRCELADGCDTLRRRQWELFGLDTRQWFPGIDGWACRTIAPEVPPNWREHALAYISRGFTEHVTCPAARWLERADDVLLWHPVRRVRLTSHPDTMVLYELNGGESPGNVIAHHEAILNRRWPGVAFELPAVITADWSVGTGDIIADLNAMRERIPRDPVMSFALPPNLVNAPPG